MAARLVFMYNSSIRLLPARLVHAWFAAAGPDRPRVPGRWLAARAAGYAVVVVRRGSGVSRCLPQLAVVVAESPDWYPGAIGLSADLFVWVGVTGPRASSGGCETARFYSCKRTAELAPCDVEAGPSLPMTSGRLQVAVSGKWAAVVGTPGRITLALGGMNSRYAFVRDIQSDPLDASLFDGWLRYDLKLLSEYATPL